MDNSEEEKGLRPKNYSGPCANIPSRRRQALELGGIKFSTGSPVFPLVKTKNFRFRIFSPLPHLISSSIVPGTLQGAVKKEKEKVRRPPQRRDQRPTDRGSTIVRPPPSRGRSEGAAAKPEEASEKPDSTPTPTTTG